MKKVTVNTAIFLFLLVSVVFVPATGLTAQDGGYSVTSELWAKAVLQVPGNPVTLVWSEVGSDTTPSGAKVISGYFYADPNDFAFGSQYNPELFVKIYIDSSGWCNMAFNHVTVDDVVVYSAHNYSGTVDQTGTAMLTGRLVEHTYTGVGTGESATGIWSGSWNSEEGTTGGITCNITQNGTSVSGTMTVTNTDCGTMSNVPFSGTEESAGYYTFSLSTSCQGFDVEMDFTGNRSGNSINGGYIQYVDGFWYDSGTYTLSR